MTNVSQHMPKRWGIFWRSMGRELLAPPQESPHFGVQMVPNISVKTVCCCSREKKRAMSGRSLRSGIVGMSS